MAELRAGADDFVGPRLAEIASRFPGLGRPLRVLRDGLSPNSLTCLFETPAGRFVAKGTRPGRKAPGWLAREHEVMLAAAEAGLPVPRPIAAPEGTLAEMGGVEWAVFEAARGEDRYKDASVFDPFRTDAEAVSAGKTLARFHLALEGFDLPPRPFVGPVVQCGLAFSPDLAGDFAKLCQVAAGGTPALPGFPEALRLFDALRPGPDSRVSPDRAPGSAGILPAPGVIHGDWIKRNLFFEGSEVSAILDFDLCNRGPAVFDLALAISALAYPWPLLRDGGKPHLRQGESLRAGYEEVCPLSPAEAARFEALLPVCRFEYHLSLSLTSLAARDEIQARWFWDGQLASLRWWYDRLADG